MEFMADDAWLRRISALEAGLKSVPNHIPVHVELASMVKSEFMSALINNVSIAYLFPTHTAVDIFSGDTQR